YAYLLPLAAGCALGGCVDNQASVDIDRVLFVSQMSMCDADPANTLQRSHGLLDVGIVAGANTDGYVAAPVVRNNMPLRATSGMIDLDAVTLKSFYIKLRPDATLSGALPLAQRIFNVPVGGARIEAGGTGLNAVFVEIVPAQIARLLAAAVQPGAQTTPLSVVHMRPVVARADGSLLGGGWYDYPVEICNFCLAGGPPVACPQTAQLRTTVLETGCRVQQDDPVTCCTKQNVLLCGASVPQTTM